MSWPGRDDIVQSAIDLSARGYIVHELCPPTHTCGSPGKVPHRKGWNEGGPKSAKWIYSSFRSPSNLGLRCVPELLIVDCDVSEDEQGLEQLRDLHARHGQEIDNDALMVYTGRRGFHLWYRVPDGVEVAINRKLGGLIDTRTANAEKRSGQVVIPPSLHANGRRYTWIQEPPALADLPTAPDWMLEALAPAQPKALPPKPQRTFGDAAADSTGWDSASREYWRNVIDGLAFTEPGGNGVQGRNAAVFRAGCTARRLHNAIPFRAVPVKALLFDDVLRAARSAGLTAKAGELERQFNNGWDDVGGEALYPASSAAENAAANR